MTAVAPLFRLIRLPIAILCFTGLLFGCAGYKNALDKSLHHASMGEYQQAMETLENSSLAKSSKNRLLYLMEKGVLQNLAGDFLTSNQTFEAADSLGDELFTQSFSDKALSFVTNDNITEYSGADYELPYLSYYKILNYLALNDLDGARVESRRIDEKLNYLTDNNPDQADYIKNPFLRLVTGFIYEGLGEYNDAFIAYRKSLQGYGGISAPPLIWPRLHNSARRSGLTDDYLELKNKTARAGDRIKDKPFSTALVMLVGYGSAPTLREVSIVAPSGHGYPIKVAMPEFVSRSSTAPEFKVSIDRDVYHHVERGVNIDQVARDSLEARKGEILLKAIARAVVKQTAAHETEKKLGGLAAFGVQLAGLLTENADLRSWDNLPAEILVAVIPAEPGEQQISLQMGGDVRTFDVTIKPNRLNFLSTRIF